MTERQAAQCVKLLNPGEEQKGRMWRGILKERCGGSPVRRMPRRAVRFQTVLTTLVLVCLLLTTTAVAAEYLGLDLDFLTFLRPNGEEQAAELAQGAYTVDESVSNESGTVTVKQVVGDSNVLHVLLEFTAPAGTVLDQARYRFADSDFDAGLSSFSWDFSKVEDENSGDNRVSMVLSVLTESLGERNAVRLRLSDLQAAGPFPAEFHTVCSGEWELSFSLDYREYSGDQPVDLPVTMFGFPATVKSVSVSPISLSLKLESTAVENISQRGREAREELGPNRYRDGYPVTLHFRDGTSLTTEIFTGFVHADFLNEKLLIIKTFDEAISHKEVCSITFFGAEIPVCREEGEDTP